MFNKINKYHTLKVSPPHIVGGGGGGIEEKLVVCNRSSISIELPKSVQQKEQIVGCNLFYRKAFKNPLIYLGRKR